MSTIQRKKIRQRVHHRIRKRITGTAERPRLAVHFSNKGVYAQLINDEAGRTIVLDRAAMIALADEAGIAVVAVDPAEMGET